MTTPIANRTLSTNSRQANPVGRPSGSSREKTIVKISEQALAIFTQKGFANTTFKDIARGANISPAAIYQYFQSKSDLYICLLDNIYQRLGPSVQQRIASEKTLKSTLQSLLQLTISLHEKSPEVTNFLAITAMEYRRDEDLKRCLETRQNGIIDAVIRLFDHAKNSGEIQSSKSSHSLAMLFIGSAIGIVIYQQSSNCSDIGEAIDGFSDLINNNIFNDAPPQPSNEDNPVRTTL